MVGRGCLRKVTSSSYTQKSERSFDRIFKFRPWPTTAWKVSVVGVFLVRIFPHWENIRNSGEWGKTVMRYRKTPNTNTFYAVYFRVLQTTDQNKPAQTDRLFHTINFPFNSSKAFCIMLICGNGKFHLYIWRGKNHYWAAQQNLICLDIRILQADFELVTRNPVEYIWNMSEDTCL